MAGPQVQTRILAAKRISNCNDRLAEDVLTRSRRALKWLDSLLRKNHVATTNSGSSSVNVNFDTVGAPATFSPWLYMQVTPEPERAQRPHGVF
jgi:hypothetical protein